MSDSLSTALGELADSPDLIKYEIESGYMEYNSRLRKEIKEPAHYVGKGIRITSFKGFNEKLFKIPADLLIRNSEYINKIYIKWLSIDVIHGNTRIHFS